jgi:hypothetical protein
MAGVNAVFVDGVGRVRRCAVADAAAYYYWPVEVRANIATNRVDSPSVLPTNHKAAFARLAQLTDLSYVYVHADARMEPWTLDIPLTITHPARKQLLQTAMKEMYRPAVLLLETTMAARGLYRYEGVRSRPIEGAGR